jgi:hypothetical protein
MDLSVIQAVFPTTQRIYYFICYLFAVYSRNISNYLEQGDPTFFSFPRAKNDFPIGPKGQETLPGTISEN